MNSGISAGCITVIVLNLLFNHLAIGRAKDQEELRES